MLRGARLLLRSAVAAFSRLAHALISLALVMSLCSPTSSSPTVIPAAAAPRQQQQQARPATTTGRKKQQQLAVVEDDRDHHHLSRLLVPAPLPAPPPAFVGNNTEEQENKKKKAATRGSRPPRLVIPLPVVARAAGVDPFGVAADWETDVAATEVEVQGDGFCLASRRGVRHAMEDGYGVVTAAADDIRGSGSQMAFYGVYDGHGGRAAVDFVADKLGKNVMAAAAASSRRRQEEAEEEDGEQLEEDGVTAAIRSAYLTTDREFLSQQGVRGGACAVTALVKDGELYVANVGDCRAVLGTSDGAATALTSDHTAGGREDERRRIESTGGYVSCGSSGVWRVQGSLAVTRALGDAAVKPWVSGEPEVSRRRITPGCRFLVLATDGLWNKVSCQEAVDAVFVAAAGAATTAGASVGVGPACCCKDLVALARSRGSRDDITVMVVDLQRFLPPIVVR